MASSRRLSPKASSTYSRQSLRRTIPGTSTATSRCASCPSCFRWSALAWPSTRMSSRTSRPRYPGISRSCGRRLSNWRERISTSTRPSSSGASCSKCSVWIRRSRRRTATAGLRTPPFSRSYAKTIRCRTRSSNTVSSPSCARPISIRYRCSWIAKTGASTRASTKPSRRRAGCRHPIPTCRTFPCVPSSAAASARPSSRRKAACSSRLTTRRSSSGCLRIFRETRVLSMRS